MLVHVRAFGGWRAILPNGLRSEDIEVSECASVGDLLDMIGARPAEVQMLIVNGERVDRNHVLRAHDEVTIYSPIGGG